MFDGNDRAQLVNEILYSKLKKKRLALITTFLLQFYKYQNLNFSNKGELYL